ncbi:hypothetical protein D6D25_03608 [Aureobasidium pullulans]|nr:hypothetical protein D6D25_03608 [Aureobasidium pullulans]
MADHHVHQQSSLKRKRSPTDHAPAARIKQEDNEPVEQIDRSYDQNGSSLISLLIERDRYAPMTDRIMGYLGVVDILALTGTSKSLSNLYNDSLPRYWDIDQRLSRFVSDPTKFRRILGRNNGLIVGSFPLQFFSRLHWDDSSLDILVQEGEAAKAMKKHIRSQRYLEPNTINYDMGHTEIDIKWTPWTRQGRANTVINLITVPDIPIHGFLLGPGSTTTANACFITWNKAYCLFPRRTFLRGEINMAFNVGPDRLLARDAMLERYKRRGWYVGDRPMQKETDSLQDFDNAISSLDGARRIGDAKMWSIPLDCDVFNMVPEVVSRSRSFYETNTFQVVTHREHGKELSYKIHTEAFQCCTLRYRYTFDFMEYPRDDFHSLSPRCCAQIIPLASVRSTITEELAVAFTEKAIEFDTVDRTYCSDPNCATFIPADVILNDIATCGNCGMTTCAICKAASHLNDCPQDENIRALLQQAEEMQWQRCSECLRIVQRDTGCNHISCRCGAEFCYVCGEPYNGLGDHPCADGNRWERNPFYKLYQLPRDVVEPEGDASPSPEPDTEL